MVVGYCTCGAKLPDDALFCHKCGKPQREDLLQVEEAPPPPIPVITVPLPSRLPPIGIRNAAAVRAAILAGFTGFALSMLSGSLKLPAVTFLGLVAAGFLAVFVYEKRTGERLSMLHGAHLGWLSGIVGFAVMLPFMVVALMNKDVIDAMRQQLSRSAMSPADVDQMVAMMHNPSVMLGLLLGTFVLMTALYACGGALGAKLLHRD